MAVDEALLESAAQSDQLTLRFYTWREATLSLGYFQGFQERDSHAASRDCPLVRRPSGGGAILHDRELTYSLIVPHSHPLARTPKLLYDAAHETLVQTLAQWRVAARLQPEPDESPGQQPFLCFQRRATGDVLLTDFKIAGSAQRRPQGAVLQHGSVLLNRSPAAPELPGISDLAGIELTAAELLEAWKPRLAERLHVEPSPGKLTATEAAAADRLVQSKYGSPAWTERR